MGKKAKKDRSKTGGGRKRGTKSAPKVNVRQRPATKRGSARPDTLAQIYARLVAEVEKFFDGEYGAMKDEMLEKQIAQVSQQPSVWYQLLGGNLAVLRFEAGFVHLVRRDSVAYMYGQVFAALQHILRSQKKEDREDLEEAAKWAAKTLARLGPVPALPEHRGQKRTYKIRLFEVAKAALIRHEKQRAGGVDLDWEANAWFDEMIEFGMVPFVATTARSEYRHWLGASGKLKLERALAIEILLRAYLLPRGYPMLSGVAYLFDEDGRWVDRIENELRGLKLRHRKHSETDTARAIMRAFARALGLDGKNFLSIFDKKPGLPM